MLRDMRKNASSWIIKILLSLIVIAFIFMGVGSYQSEEINRIGVVNGQSISVNEYREAYQNMLERLRQQFGGSVSAEMIEMLKIKKQTVDQLVGQKLMQQEAKKLRLQVTDEELVAAIRAMTVFSEAGEFSRSRYDRVLTRAQLSPEIFEARQRDAMLMEKLQSLIADNVKVTDKEARTWFNWQNAEVNLHAVCFKPQTYKDIAPSSEEIKAYFEAHTENYKTEEKMKACYVKFSQSEYLDKVSISDEDMQSYFEDNPQKFETPKTVEARHILIKVDPKAKEAEVEEKRAKAQEIANQAHQPDQDFTKLAQEFSEDSNKKDGGLLKAFKREDMVKPFSDKAFSMQPGEVSDPVRTKFGWHIIKIEKINEPALPAFEAVKETIKKSMAAEKAKIKLLEDADSIFAKAVATDDLAAVAKERNLKLSTTEYFSKMAMELQLPDPVKFAKAAFDLPENGISDVLELNDGYYILQAMEKVPQKTANFEDITAKVKADLIKELQEAKASAEADQFFNTLTADPAALAAEAAKRGLPVIETGFFNREADVPHIGMERAINEKAFGLTESAPRPTELIKGDKGYFVIQLKERKLPDDKNFEIEKEKLIQQLTQQKRSKQFSNWLAQMRSKSKISIQEGYL